MVLLLSEGLVQVVFLLLVSSVVLSVCSFVCVGKCNHQTKLMEHLPMPVCRVALQFQF